MVNRDLAAAYRSERRAGVRRGSAVALVALTHGLASADVVAALRVPSAEQLAARAEAGVRGSRLGERG